MLNELSTQEFKNMLRIMDKVKTTDNKQATDILAIANYETVTFIKSNSETTIKYVMDSYVDKGGIIVLPNESAEIIKKLRENLFTLTDNKIKTEKKEISFTEKDLIEINTYENIEKVFSITQKELLRMLQVTYAIAQDDTRPVLTGVFFNKNQTCALDGYRMSVRESNQYKNDTSFIVNQFSIEILKSILKDTDKIVNVYLSNENNSNVVKFEVDNITIIAKCLEGEFIKYSSIIPDDFKYKSIVKSEELLEEIDFIKSADKRGFLKTVFTEDKIILKGSQCKEVYNEKLSYEDQEKRQKPLTEEYNEKLQERKLKLKNAKLNNKQFKTKEPKCKEAKFFKRFDLVPVNDIVSNINAVNELNKEKEFVIAYNPQYMYESLKQYNDKVEIRMTSRVAPLIITNDIDKGLELVLPIRILD